MEMQQSPLVTHVAPAMQAPASTDDVQVGTQTQTGSVPRWAREQEES